jgi:LAS superfamily LD-carboxypeptidase LdcB
MPTSEIYSEIQKLFEYLGIFTSNAPTKTETSDYQEPKSQKFNDQSSGWVRMVSHPSQEVQRIASLILKKYKGHPYGTTIAFKADGKDYIALLEEHEGGSVPGKHPGISVLEKRSGTPSGSQYDPKISELDPSIQDAAKDLLRKAKEIGISLKITSGYRSHNEQEKLYQQGRATKGDIVTNVQAGKSLHNYGMAFDVAPLDENENPYWPNDNKLWDTIGSIGKSVGLKWGGDFSKPDYPHFEHPAVNVPDLISGVHKTKYTKNARIKILTNITKNATKL